MNTTTYCRTVGRAIATLDKGSFARPDENKNRDGQDWITARNLLFGILKRNGYEFCQPDSSRIKKTRKVQPPEPPEAIEPGVTIDIAEQVRFQSDMPDVLRRVADLVDQGYTSGIDPTWSLQGEDAFDPATGKRCLDCNALNPPEAKTCEDCGSEEFEHHDDDDSNQSTSD